MGWRWSCRRRRPGLLVQALRRGAMAGHGGRYIAAPRPLELQGTKYLPGSYSVARGIQVALMDALYSLQSLLHRFSLTLYWKVVLIISGSTSEKAGSLGSSNSCSYTTEHIYKPHVFNPGMTAQVAMRIEIHGACVLHHTLGILVYNCLMPKTNKSWRNSTTAYRPHAQRQIPAPQQESTHLARIYLLCHSSVRSESHSSQSW